MDKYAKHCYKQLERICEMGAKRGLKGPTTDEIQSAIVSISSLEWCVLVKIVPLFLTEIPDFSPFSDGENDIIST